MIGESKKELFDFQREKMLMKQPDPCEHSAQVLARGQYTTHTLKKMLYAIVSLRISTMNKHLHNTI